MATSILVTKFFIPPIRSELVPRPRLIQRLNTGLQRKLILVSAPAGFGKTTLLAEWVEGSRLDNAGSWNNLQPSSIDLPPVFAWLSLDEDDNDPQRFLTYFITALNRIEDLDASLGNETLGMLQSSQPPHSTAILTSLINELAEINARIILIFDDYHLIDNDSIHGALCFFLENIPPQVHLVIATREDPYLPMARLRARGELTELRAADLRFTSSEAAEFLNRAMGLDLSAGDIAALENRTEGWIAGLQLAAISMQGSKDASAFINSFTGSHRFVLDYLVTEILEQQSENLQTFLLQTSILDRLSGSLCDAVRFDNVEPPARQDDGQHVLETLERANLFIAPLDTERHWYRYHHLFADLLRQRLHQIQPEQELTLHFRASQWYEDNGFTAQAIKHSLRAKDYNRAANLAELAWREMHMSYRGVIWLRWVEAMPDEVVRARPVLSTGCGWSLIDVGDLEGADLRLRDAERWLDARTNLIEQPEIPSEKPVKLDGEALRSLSASIANARAYLTQAVGDVAATEKYAQRALDLLPEDEYFERGLSAILQGFAYWSNGNLETAHRAISDAVSYMRKLGKMPFVISFTSYLADIMIAQGRLNETKKMLLQLLDMATTQGEPELREIAVVHLGLSELFYEQGDLQAARWHLSRSEELGELPAFPPWYRHWVLMQVRLKETEGDLEGVIKILNKADHLYYRHPIPDVRPLAVLIARARLVEGKLSEALLWVHARGLSVDDDLSYLCEFEHVTLARILIARYKRDRADDYIHAAIGLLERLLQAAEDGGRMGSAVEILALQALAFEAQGKLPAALKSLERALALAEPQGFFQLFVHEGPPMARMLYKALPQGIATDYVHRLLAAFPVGEPEPAGGLQAQFTQTGLVEPLSDRELEVLQLIAAGLTNPEIATRLYLSLNTVKVHSRNIYGKLGVNNRIQAGARARALGILRTN